MQGLDACQVLILIFSEHVNDSDHVQREVAKAFSSGLAVCLCYEALSEWHFGEIASSHATIAEAISLAKEWNDMYPLVLAVWFAAILSHCEGNHAEVERLASELIELSTRHSSAHYLADGKILRGWARSASGDTPEGISLIEDGNRGHSRNRLDADGAPIANTKY
jgi:hypothetical protein